MLPVRYEGDWLISTGDEVFTDLHSVFSERATDYHAVLDVIFDKSSSHSPINPFALSSKPDPPNLVNA